SSIVSPYVITDPSSAIMKGRDGTAALALMASNKWLVMIIPQEISSHDGVGQLSQRPSKSGLSRTQQAHDGWGRHHLAFRDKPFMVLLHVVQLVAVIDHQTQGAADRPRRGIAEAVDS